MTIDLEQRLRSDLPRLAELLADVGDSPALATTPQLRARRPGVVLGAVAALITAALVVSAVVVVDHGSDDPLRIDATGAQVLTDGWTVLPPSGLERVPGAALGGGRENVAVVWTGSEVLVWGGNADVVFFQSGAAYDPVTQTWRSITSNQWAGPGTFNAWTGDRLVIASKRGGAVYNLARDSWSDLPRLPGDSPGAWAGIVWSGTDLYGAVSYDDNVRIARYEPSHDRWTLGAAQPASFDTHDPTASGSVWTQVSLTTWIEDEVVVWDGRSQGWAYRPASDTWRNVPELPGDLPNVASTLAAVDGDAVVTYAYDAPNGRTVGVMRLEGDRWAPIVETAAPDFELPTTTADGQTLYVVDRTGSADPLRVDLGSAAVTRLAGYPLVPGIGTTATWAGNGLFVWGGLFNHGGLGNTSTTPAQSAWFAPG